MQEDNGANKLDTNAEIIAPEEARRVQAVAARHEVTQEEQIAQSLIPYNHDDARAKYLGYRSSGFTTREALKLIGYGASALSMWRRDSEFLAIENDLPRYRKQLANEYVHLEFIRNYRLVLLKDYRVYQRSLTTEKDIEGHILPMSDQDHDYLLKARTHYTPQQLQIIESLMSGTEPGKEFNFTDFILAAAAQTKKRVTVESKKATFELTREEITTSEEAATSET